MASQSEVLRFADLVTSLQKRVEALESSRQTPQLNHSSLEDGGLPVFDEGGQLRQYIGKQSDGTFAVTYANGTKPPKPSEPTVSARQLAIVVGWDGTFADGAARPGDFARIDIHMSTDPDFEPTGATVYGSLNGEGAVVIPADNQEHFIKVVAVTLADVASDPTTALAIEALPASQISSEYVYAGTVTADQITTGTLRADVTLSSALIAGDAQRNVTLGSDGLVSRSGEVVSVNIPTDPEQVATFRGQIEAGGLTVVGPAAFRSDSSEISTGGAITLQSNITPPQAAPNIFVHHPDTWSYALRYGYGLTELDGVFYTVRNADNFDIIAAGQDGTEIKLVDGSERRRPYGGLINLSGFWYTVMLGDNTGASGKREWYLAMFHPDGAEVGRTYLGTITSWSYELGTDGTNLLLAWRDPATNRFTIQTRDPGSLAATDSITTVTNAGFKGDVVGVLAGNFDFGARYYAILTSTGENVWVFNTSGGYVPELIWPAASPGRSGGLHWDGTRFWSTDDAYSELRSIYQYSTYTWVGSQAYGDYATRIHTAATTWYHSVEGYETPIGPKANFTMKKRAFVEIAAGAPIPNQGEESDPDSVRIYAVPNPEQDPLKTLVHQADPPVGSRFRVYGDDILTDGPAPPWQNTFPSAKAGVIRNSTDTMIISGDGSITGSFPGILMDGISLPGNFYPPDNTWTDWGETVTIPKPTTGWVKIRLSALGFAYYSGSTTQFAGIRVALSIDGGQTWHTGEGIYDNVGASTPRGSMSCVERVVALPTADILFRTQIHAGVGGADGVEFRRGDMDWLVVPTTPQI